MSENNLEFPLMLLFTILALVVVLTVAWFAIRFLASIHRTNPNGGKPVKVIHTTAIGSRERLVLIQYRGRDILLGVSGGGISVIESDLTIQESETKNDLL